MFEIVWRQHHPIGAYEILAEIAKDRVKAAPPTVYRALDFLREAGLVHRVDSLNAFLGCDRPAGRTRGPVPGVRKMPQGHRDRRSRAHAQPRAHARELGYRLEGSAVEIKALCELMPRRSYGAGGEMEDALGVAVIDLRLVLVRQRR